MGCLNSFTLGERKMGLEKLWGDITPTYFFKVELPDRIEIFCWLVEGLEATGDFKQVTLSRAKVMDYWNFRDWGRRSQENAGQGEMGTVSIVDQSGTVLQSWKLTDVELYTFKEDRHDRSEMETIVLIANVITPLVS